MHKNMKHLSTFIISILIFVLLFSIPCMAANKSQNGSTGYQVVIEDEADLLSKGEEEMLASRMYDITAYGNVGFITTNVDNYSSVDKFAEQKYRNLFGKKSGTIFVIDMDKRKVFIFSDGKIYRTITKSYANTITDNIYTYATKKDYYECADKAFEQITTLLDGGRISQPMKYICNGLLALIIALLINYFIVRKVCKLHAASDKEILSTIFSGVTINNPEKNFVRQTRTYSPPSSSGGGGSGGGGGGGSSGGGGGHSF